MTLIDRIEITLQAIADAEGDASVFVSETSVWYDTEIRVEADPPEHAVVFAHGGPGERVLLNDLDRTVRVAIKMH